MSATPPSIAASIVTHASAVCKHEDHLWDVIEQLSIPTENVHDQRQSHKTTYETDSLLRAFLYQNIRGFSQAEFASRLSQRPVLLNCFGFESAPTQQTLSHSWNQLDQQGKAVIEAAATGIAKEAAEHGIISEALTVETPDDDDPQPDKERDYQRTKTTKTIQLARKHALSEFDTGRAPHRTYSDADIWDMFARLCERNGSAHAESEYGWLTADDLTCHGSTFLRAIKKAGTPQDSETQLTLADFENDDPLPRINRIRDSLMESFDAATHNIINSIRGDDPFDDRNTVAAIDITHEQFHASPWTDKAAGSVKADFPAMVSGYKKGGEYKRGYKYATITLVGNHVPIILGIEPVKENSKWEPADSSSFSKAQLVDRLLEKAQRFVDLNEVLFDRGFYSHDVYATVHDRGLIYTSPVPTYEDDYEVIADIEAHETADAAVNHDVPFGHGGEIHHHAEMLYVPSQSDDADGAYAVFVTNRDRVEPNEIQRVCNGYRRRWDIENQYKSIKEFLPKTSSKDYRVRLCNFAFASLIYNLWRLTDYLVKVALDRDIRSSPVVTAKTFVRALGEHLRKFG